MGSISLQDQYTRPDDEQGLLAAMAAEPALFWEVESYLGPDTFRSERSTWIELSAAIRTSSTSSLGHLVQGWSPTSSPIETAKLLRGMERRRYVAELHEVFAKGLHDQSRDPDQVVSELERKLAERKAGLTDVGTRPLWGSIVIDELLERVTAWNAKRELNPGRDYLGIPTGFDAIDSHLNGLSEGLYILAGAPGAGKTTLATQIAYNVANSGLPVVYVTCENSPANLMLKILCQLSGQSLENVTKGRGDVRKLEEAYRNNRTVLDRIALVGGSSALTTEHIRIAAAQAISRHPSEEHQCLIVVDFLQTFAKLSRQFASLSSVREKVELAGVELRGLGVRFRSPVIAIASQNRQSGYSKPTGDIKGKAIPTNALMDSLKESGDIEYAADAILILTQSTRAADADTTEIDCYIPKNRNGKPAPEEPVRLTFIPKYGKFKPSRSGVPFVEPHSYR
jgi:replicative DNA helicase